VSRDQAIGAALMVGSLAGIAIYGWLLTSPYYLLILQITAFVAVAGVLGILAWIGYTLATTPPPKPIEEIEKEIEEELKKLEEEAKKEQEPAAAERRGQEPVSSRGAEAVRRAAPLLALFLAALVLAQPQLAVSTDSPVYEPGSLVTVRVEGPPGAPVGWRSGGRRRARRLEAASARRQGGGFFQLELAPACSEGSTRSTRLRRAPSPKRRSWC